MKYLHINMKSKDKLYGFRNRCIYPYREQYQGLEHRKFYFER